MQVANISKDIVKIEAVMQDMVQADCPVVHRFGDGIYIREVVMPAGILAIGHIQKFKQNNFLLQGKIAMIGDEGIKILEAPLFFVGDEGRKIGYVIETVVWQNIWATDETDIEMLENTYMEMSDHSTLKREEFDALEFIGREVDREDYLKVIDACPFTHDEVKVQVENEDDQIDMPQEWCIQVRKSNIQGQGCFTSWTINETGVIGPARLSGKRTPLGRYTNHSLTPNAKPELMDNGDIYLVADRDIFGCKGGGHGEEITVDYREMLKLSGVEL
jgi:hypothetical protein